MCELILADRGISQISWICHATTNPRKLIHAKVILENVNLVKIYIDINSVRESVYKHYLKATEVELLPESDFLRCKFRFPLLAWCMPPIQKPSVTVNDVVTFSSVHKTKLFH